MKKNITVVLLLMLAAGCASDPEAGAHTPPLDATRKVSEQDCTKPFVDDGGNLLCREITAAERRARVEEEARQAFLRALPADIASYNDFSAVVTAKSANIDAALAFVDFVTTPEAAMLMKSKGLEPTPKR
jgi:ABC-type glycerol-3-phosphate transport system substrate-binding protein